MVSAREYCREDFEQLRELALGLYDTMHPTEAVLESDSENFDVFLQYLIGIQSKESGRILVAEQEGRLVGFVCLLGPIRSQGLDDIDEAYAFLSDLFVRPDCRGKGIGRLLTEKAERHARSSGAGRIALKVLAQNAVARRFYDHLEYQDRFVVMSKQLRELE